MNPGNRISYLFAIVLIVIIGAILSGIFTAQGIKSLWWRDLKKSKAQPESQIFSIAWLVIYLLLIATVFVAVSNAKNQKEINLIMIALITNMFLQVLWCAVFFGKKNVGTGLIILILTFVAGIWLLYLVWKQSPIAGAFLAIYLGWLGLATYINYDTYYLNAKAIDF